MKSARPALVTPKQFMNPVLSRNGELGHFACEIMADAINAVDPYDVIQQQVKKSHHSLIIGGDQISLEGVDRVFLLGLGKASVPMTKALWDVFDGDVHLAEVVTKDEKFLDETGYGRKLSVHLGAHPIPTEASIKATEAALAKLSNLSESDLVLVAISGGGSALFTAPISGVSLDDLQKTTEILLRSGADIHEINTIRKHLDRVKGGRLAQRLYPAQVHTLILSDVVGDRLDMIASGPTVPDPTTYRDAIDILEKYRLQEQAPKGVIDSLSAGERGALAETLKTISFQKMRVSNHLVGTNIKAACAAREKAQALGFNSLILTSHLVGQTVHVAELLAAIVKTVLEHDQPVKKPACLIIGGETTVKVHGEGKGGRNQDLALNMVEKLSGWDGVLFISLATDGEDGPTDAAGAASDSRVYKEGLEKYALDLETYRESNNSYEYFSALGGLIRIGSTGTNVNDLIFILIE